jgi:hypothetical protein
MEVSVEYLRSLSATALGIGIPGCVEDLLAFGSDGHDGGVTEEANGVRTIKLHIMDPNFLLLGLSGPEAFRKRRAIVRRIGLVPEQGDGARLIHLPDPLDGRSSSQSGTDDDILELLIHGSAILLPF